MNALILLVTQIKDEIDLLMTEIQFYIIMFNKDLL